MNCIIVVFPPEFCFSKTGKIEDLQKHLELISASCWRPTRIKTQWPWDIGGLCNCDESMLR